jgi:hypothetical protein
VFTGRFGRRAARRGVVRPDLCRERGPAPVDRARAPTTTGKVERWHKTMRAEFLTEHDHQHATQADCRLESVKLAV